MDLIENWPWCLVGLAFSGLIFYFGLRLLRAIAGKQVGDDKDARLAAWGLTIAFLPAILALALFSRYFLGSPWWEGAAVFYTSWCVLGLLASGCRLAVSRRPILRSSFITVAIFLGSAGALIYSTPKLLDRISVLKHGARVNGTVAGVEYGRKGNLYLYLASPQGIGVEEGGFFRLPTCPPAGCELAVDESRRVAYSAHASFLLNDIILLSLAFAIFFFSITQAYSLITRGVGLNRENFTLDPSYRISFMVVAVSGISMLVSGALSLILSLYPGALL